MKKVTVTSLLVLMGLCLFFLITLIVSNVTGRTSISTNMNEFKQISIVEQGVIDGNEYIMFKDSVRNVRILYYNKAMVVLPSE